MASTEAVESANAIGIKKAIESALKRLNINEHGPVLVCCNFDGAAVMMGVKNGVSKLMTDKMPHLISVISVISVHCVAHKLELGVLDAAKDIDYLRKFEETIKGIYRFYAKSSKRRRELKDISEMLESDLLRYGEVKTVRWVASKGKALTAVQNNPCATTAHLEHTSSSKSSEEVGKAKYLLKEIQSIRFVKYLHFMMDYLSAITATSKKSQECKLLIMEVPEVIENLACELELKKDEPEENTRKFYKDFSVEECELKTSTAIPLKLKGPNPVQYQEDSDIEKLLTRSITYIQERFKVCKEEPLKNFQIFNKKYWPSDEKELLKFGRCEIRNLCEHYSSLLTTEQRSEMLRQWTIFKNSQKKVKTSNLQTLYTELLHTKPDDIRSLLILTDIMVTISPSTAECERQFSSTNIIKSNRRSHMKQELLEALMRLHSDGPSIERFDPFPSIHQWMSRGNGTRHVLGHRIPPKKSHDETSTQATVTVNQKED